MAAATLFTTDFKEGKIMETDIMAKTLAKCQAIVSKNVELENKLNFAIEAITVARDTAYSATQDCPKCDYIDNYLTKALKQLSDNKEEHQNISTAKMNNLTNRNKTEFEHRFTLGDIVFLTFYSKGKYRVRKKSGYKITNIRFNYSLGGDYFGGRIEKSIYYWLEGNPSVRMIEENSCFPSLEDAQKYCDEKNKELSKK